MASPEVLSRPRVFRMERGESGQVLITNIFDGEAADTAIEMAEKGGVQILGIVDNSRIQQEMAKKLQIWIDGLGGVMETRWRMNNS